MVPMMLLSDSVMVVMLDFEAWTRRPSARAVARERGTLLRDQRHVAGLQRTIDVGDARADLLRQRFERDQVEAVDARSVAAEHHRRLLPGHSRERGPECLERVRRARFL